MAAEFALPKSMTGEGARAEAEPLASDAFAGFYERSARPLWAYLARVSADAALADDLMQEAFVRFLVAQAPGDGEIAMRKYLFRIATNLLRDHWRRPRAASLEELEVEPAAERCANEARALLGPVLKQLRPRDRQILWLAYAEGYTHREIAEIAGLASASVRLLLFRARRKAAKLLEARPEAREAKP
jgi:RNA polymerase sigma-70 factor (ECF subfamily)